MGFSIVKSQLSLFMIGIMLKTSKRLKTVYIFKNNDYVSMHCPSEHMDLVGQLAEHISLVPHLHCPAVQVSVAPEQSPSVAHPFVIEKCINLR